MSSLFKEGSFSYAHKTYVGGNNAQIDTVLKGIWEIMPNNSAWMGIASGNSTFQYLAHRVSGNFGVAIGFRYNGDICACFCSQGTWTTKEVAFK